MTHMTNTRIKDTVYEDAHLEEEGSTSNLAHFFGFLKAECQRGGWQLQRISASGMSSSPTKARIRRGTKEGHINLDAWTFIL